MTPAEELEKAYQEAQMQAFKERIVRQNRAAKLASEPKRHRRPVKDKPLGDIDFGVLL